ncbi:MAG: hypothetical protein WCN88_04485 [Candidatus Falkowbacteria bacterium]
MKKNKTLYIVLGVVGALLILASLGKLTNKSAQPEMILFFGDTCPHCKNVDDFISANDVRNKLKFQELEVYNNKDNAAQLAATAKKCEIDTSAGIGVPFFFDGTTCLQGDQPIIDFLQTKIK